MNILYIADPNSIHDIKWISYFTENHLAKVFLVPQRRNYETFKHDANQHSLLKDLHIVALDPIIEFSSFRFILTIIDFIYLKRIIRKNKIDLIHIMYAEPAALWAVGKFFLARPMILTTRGTDILYTIPQAFKKKNFINALVSKLYRYALRNFDFVTFTSPRQLESYYKITHRRVNTKIVRTGVNFKVLYQPAPTVFPKEMPANDKYILFPRYMKPLYNHEFSLEAIRLLPKKIKEGYLMVFVGKDGHDKNYINAIESLMLKMSDVQFLFLPKQTQQSIFELYRRASLVVMNPKSDGSPVSAMEAVALRKKVILGPASYDPQLFGGLAFYFSKWEPKLLANLICESLSHSAGHNFKKELPEGFDRDIEMGKIYDIYQKVLS